MTIELGSIIIGALIAFGINAYENRTDIEAEILYHKDPHIKTTVAPNATGNITAKYIRYKPIGNEVNNYRDYVKWLNKKKSEIIKYDKNVEYIPRYKVTKNGEAVIENAKRMLKFLNRNKLSLR